MKLKEWLDIWLNKYIKYTVKLRTYDRYKYIIEKHINYWLGDKELDELSPQLLQDFILEKVEKGNLKTGQALANNSVISIVNVLKQALEEREEARRKEALEQEKANQPWYKKLADMFGF